MKLSTIRIQPALANDKGHVAIVDRTAPDGDRLTSPISERNAGMEILYLVGAMMAQDEAAIAPEKVNSCRQFCCTGDAA